MENNEQRFIKGFNHGYLLSKHEPVLLNSIISNIPRSSEYLEGLFSGKEEYELEIEKDKLTEMQQLRNESKDLDMDLEID